MIPVHRFGILFLFALPLLWGCEPAPDEDPGSGGSPSTAGGYDVVVLNGTVIDPEFGVDGRGHPRSTGTDAKILDDFVREARTFDYMEAVRKMSLMPAQRLEARVPAMASKGRIRVGADADLTIFDPQEVRDRATYADPSAASEGIRYVLVAGVPVVAEGELQEDELPGRGLRAPVSGGTPQP